jgi:predicted amidohydrolase YtcJ
MILCHERIYTLAPALCTAQDPWGRVEAIRILDGEVDAVGTRAQLAAQRAAGEAVIELDGACVLPGLLDTHAHLSNLGMRPGVIRLPDDAPASAWVEAVRARAQAEPAGRWIVGRGWNQAVWPPEDGQLDAHFPTHEALTQAAPAHPVLLYRVDQHALWANRAAMQAAGVWGQAPGPRDGGAALPDRQGHLSGVFLDHAMDPFEQALPPLDRPAREALIAGFAQEFLSRGVTCVHAALVEPWELPDYEAILGDGRLGLRVRAMVYDAPARLAAWAQDHRPTLDPGRWLDVGLLKMFADGALGSQGAWLEHPYQGTQHTGGPVASPDELEALARAALGRGWGVAVHAIGDRALRELLEAWARAGLSRPQAQALRWRVEHVQHASAASLDHMAALGVGAAMQPIHCTRDMRFAEQLLGPERCAWAYAWRAVLQRNIPLGLGSDHPIETLDPWAGMAAAVTRQDGDQPAGGWFPEQRLTRLEAVLGYTREGAKLVAADAGRLGVLAPGARADLVVAEVDPSTDDPRAWPSAPVRLTLAGGVPRWGALPG